MQYEPTLSRDELIDIATIKYFGNVEPAENEATYNGIMFKIRPTRVVKFG